MNFDLHSNIKVVQNIVPIVLNNDTEGTPASGVDTKGFDACEFIVSVGASADTLSGSVYLELKLQHSDDNSAWSAVSSVDDIIVGSCPRVTTVDSNGTFALIDAAAEDEFHFRIGYRGIKRYVRVFIDTTGTHTNGTPVSSIAVLSSASLVPTLDA